MQTAWPSLWPYESPAGRDGPSRAEVARSRTLGYDASHDVLVTTRRGGPVSIGRNSKTDGAAGRSSHETGTVPDPGLMVASQGLRVEPTRSVAGQTRLEAQTECARTSAELADDATDA